MNILFFMVPVAIGLGLLFLSGFLWCALSGQYDDLETPPERVLFGEE